MKYLGNSVPHFAGLAGLALAGSLVVAEGFLKELQRILAFVEVTVRERLTSALHRLSALPSGLDGDFVRLRELKGVRAPVPEVGGLTDEFVEGPVGHPEEEWTGAEAGEGVAMEVGVVEDGALFVPTWLPSDGEAQAVFEAEHGDGPPLAFGRGLSGQMLFQFPQQKVRWLLPKVEGGEEDIDLSQGDAETLMGAVADGAGPEDGGVEAEARLAGEGDDGPGKLALGVGRGVRRASANARPGS